MGDRIYDDRPDSAGLISPIVELRMVDDEGNVVADGEEGEIECSGVTMTPGYWRRPDATEKIYHGDWLRTGDVGRLDKEGFLYITGRVKDIVIRGGENIFPGEVEDVAYSHEAIEEVCVFGVPDDALGEVLAMVYFSSGKGVDHSELETYISDRLGSFKVPKYISASNESLPLNLSGKIDKKIIRDDFLSKL
jgi:long-chain acyl-CoA synthetase